MIPRVKPEGSCFSEHRFALFRSARPFGSGSCFGPRSLDTRLTESILNHMVKYNDQVLDRTFAALADPTRRALLAQLSARDGQSVSELAQPFAMSLPAIMKHLDVLSDAGLLVREKTGRVVACRLTAKPMEQAMQWLGRYQRFWSESLDRLASFLGEDPWPTKPPPQAPPQRDARKGLRRVDRPAKLDPLVRTGGGDP